MYAVKLFSPLTSADQSFSGLTAVPTNDIHVCRKAGGCLRVALPVLRERIAAGTVQRDLAQHALECRSSARTVWSRV